MGDYYLKRSEGAHSYTPDELAHRYKLFSEQGLQCYEHEGRCSQVAVTELIFYVVNPTTKARTTDKPRQVKTCSRHRLKFEQSPIYEIVKKWSLPALRHK